MDKKATTHVLSSENEEVKMKVTNLKQKNEGLSSTNSMLASQLAEKDDKLHKLIGGSQKLFEI